MLGKSYEHDYVACGFTEENISATCTHYTYMDDLEQCCAVHHRIPYEIIYCMGQYTM